MRVQGGGRYELLQRVGSGGMADVYLARVSGPAGFVRHVIVKSMRTPGAQALAMFLDEARVLATLHHQHIAQVYDLIELDDERYLLAMEYVHGHTVQTVLREAEAIGVRLPLDFALTVVEATAMALHHAHERRDAAGRPLGIVHRDVTPANIMTAFDGAVKLIDFGIATAFERSTETESGVIKGKTRYMAPEQALGGDVDRRTDVFGLGVVLYELTTQIRAFPLGNPIDIARREVVPPSAVRPGYYPVLEDVVLTAMSRDAGYRFPDADALARAVRAAGGQLGLTLGPAAIIRTMTRLFARCDEPWLTAGGGREDTGPRAVPDPAARAAPGGAGGAAWAAEPEEPVRRPRRHPVSWGVVPATGALADWEGTIETKDSTERFLSIEAEPPEAPGTFALGTPHLPRLAAHGEDGDAAPRPLFLEVEEISDDAGPAAGSASPRAAGDGPGDATDVAGADGLDRAVDGEPGLAGDALVVSAELELATSSPTRTLMLRPRSARAGGLALAGLIAIAVAGGLLAGPDDAAEVSPDDAAAVSRAVVAPAPPAGGRRAGVDASADAVAAGAPPAPSAPPALAPPVAPPRRPAGPPSPTIRLRVVPEPADATVLVDGRRLGRGAVTLELPRDDRTVPVKVRRRGFRPQVVEVPLADDVQLEITLPPR